MKRRSFIKLFAWAPAVGALPAIANVSDVLAKPVRVLFGYYPRSDSYKIILSVSTEYEQYTAESWVDTNPLGALVETLKGELVDALKRDGVNREDLVHLPMPSYYHELPKYSSYPKYISL